MNPVESLRQAHAFLCVVWFLLNAFSCTVGANAQSKKVPTTAGNAQILSLADFGASGDGVTDDGPAFQSALDALAAAGGGTLFVPAGHYLTAAPVRKDFSGVSGSVTLQGVASGKMPASPTATGDQLSQSLDLPSEIIPATGSDDSVFTLLNLHDLAIEELTFIG